MRDRRVMWGSVVLMVSGIFLGAGVPTARGATVLNSFDPATMGSLCGVGFNGNVYLSDCSTTTIGRFTPSGALLAPLTRPGAASNDIDLDFAVAALVVNGTTVPIGTLLVSNGDDGNSLRALDPITGAELASTVIPGTQTVGGSHDPSRNSMFQVEWVPDVIREIGTSTNPAGTLGGPFPVTPLGSPAFGVFFGDVEVSLASGNLLIVSSDQNRIRELGPTGTFIQDIDLTSLNVTDMSGIACNDAGGTAFISTTGGTVYELSGVCGRVPTNGENGGTVPEPTTLLLLASGLLGIAGACRVKRG